MKLKNSLADLNNHLFEELERINDEELTGDALDEELRKARGIVSVSHQIIENANLVYKAVRHMDEMGMDVEMPSMLVMKDE